jgi:hypothetical protein
LESDELKEGERMKDTLTEKKARAEPKTLARAPLTKILTSLGECIIACFKAEGSEWALRPVRVEREIEVGRR